MRYDQHSVGQIFDSEQIFIPSDESPLYFADSYLYESSIAMIEQYHYESTEIGGSRNHLQTSQNLSTIIPSKNYLMGDDIQDIQTLKQDSDVYAIVGEKDEDLSESLFSPSRSGINLDSSFDEKTVEVNGTSKKKRITKPSKDNKQKSYQKRKYQRRQNQVNRPKKNTSNPNRKGKHSQSKTQKFIYFMTQYHYSKNFGQYLKKKIIQNKENQENYTKSTQIEKIKVIENIIFKLNELKISIHNKVIESNFFKKFNPQQQELIKNFFWQVMQMTYKIRLELEKEKILGVQNGQKNENQGFFDPKGEAQFNKIFETLSAEELYAKIFTVCNFQAKLEEAMTKMAKKQEF